MMTTVLLFVIPTFIVGLILGWYILSRPLIKGPRMSDTWKAGKYTNRKGKHITVSSDGSWSVDVKELLKSPTVQDDLYIMGRLYKRQTIMALWEGKRPPNQVGGYGVLTKKKLIIEWNDEWQKEMDSLSEYHDIDYDIFFDIPKDFPPVGIILTADEIVEAYGREEKNS